MVLGLCLVMMVAFVFIMRQRRGWNFFTFSIRKLVPVVPQMSPAELAAWLRDSNRAQPILLDVRSQEEYAVSHLAGAQCVAPSTKASEIAQRIQKDQPLVLYCTAGYRSSKLAARLMKSGFTNVHNLEGAIFAWANAGLPLEKSDASRATTVHPCLKPFEILLEPRHRHRK